MELQSIWDVVSNLAGVGGISVSAVFTANWIAPIKSGKDDDDRGGKFIESPQPEPTGGDKIDWDKFHEDLDKYSKEIEKEDPAGVGIS